MELAQGLEETNSETNPPLLHEDGCRHSPFNPIPAAPVASSLMLTPTVTFAGGPIVFVDDHAGPRRVFVSDSCVPAIAFVIADDGCGSVPS
jgi:hypothetical protein